MFLYASEYFKVNNLEDNCYLPLIPVITNLLIFMIISNKIS